MKKLIILGAALLLVIILLLAKFYLGSKGTPGVPSPGAASRSSAAIYLFHNPRDRDPGCVAIYSIVSEAEKALLGKAGVYRPDLKADQELIRQFGIKAIPTVVLVFPDETVKKIEGEGGEVERVLRKNLEEFEARVSGKER